MVVKVVTEPTMEPVSLAEAREWCKLEADDTDHDNILTMLIRAMRRYAENLTGRAFVSRSLQLILEGWPGDLQIILPQPPLISVSSVVYIDEDGAQQTLAADQYVVHDYREPALIVPAWGVVWPGYRSLLNAITVNYTAGYPAGSPATDLAQNVPDTVRTWMQARLATLFDNREQIIIGTIVNPIPRDFADGLLDELVLGSRLF